MKPVGAGFAPECEPLKPNWTEAFGAIEPFQGALTAVTVEPDCVTVELQDCVTRWPPAKDHVRVHPLIGVEPTFVTVTAPVNPVFQLLAL